jgi:2-dehydro-3-deoxy-D-gluconate 5-dehydrogenase
MILDSFNLNGKNALVTGSTRGLGAAIAIALAEAGANVAVHGRSGKGEETCSAIRKLGCRALPLAGDVADPEVCASLVRDSIEGLGSLDILVNNAGMIRRAPAVEYSLQDWNQLIAANLSSVFRLSQLAGKHMLERGQGGKIVNIASRFGINVNAIAPGYMATDNTEALRKDADRSRQIMERIPAGRWGTPKDVAGAALFLCSSASAYIHGHVMAVDGGWLAR